MPYIPDHNRRHAIDTSVSFAPLLKDFGELNYAICELVQQYIAGKCMPADYITLTTAHKMMLDAAHEYQRCVLDGYEDLKREQNDDIWWIRPQVVK